MSDDQDLPEGFEDVLPASDAQDDLANEWAAALENQAESESNANYTRVALDNLTHEGTPLDIKEGNPNLDVILDVPVTLSMEVGNTNMSIRSLLQLNQGSVVELDRIAGESLDIMVNGMLVAHGEVVVVNDKFGMRLTDILSPQERIKKLRS
jgi:flagellar motor switch protein FliN/FliY